MRLHFLKFSQERLNVIQKWSDKHTSAMTRLDKKWSLKPGLMDVLGTNTLSPYLTDMEQKEHQRHLPRKN